MQRQYTDPETGLQYLRARYYDPATGQFLTRDPLASRTRDSYGYAARSPLNFGDPSGLDCNSDSFFHPSDWGDCASDAKDTATDTISDATPDCFTWQNGCESIVSRASGGEYCSALFDEGCERTGSISVTICPAYGCERLSYDFGSGEFHHHEALGMAFNAGVSYSRKSTSCAPHDEAFGTAGPLGISTTRSTPRGPWSDPAVDVGVNPPGMNFGFGLVHWLN